MWVVVGCITTNEAIYMKSDQVKYGSGLGKAQMHVGFKVKYCHKIFFGPPGREEAVRGDFP
ncbi:MAG: hypothetical protein GF334_04125 [Candidatus Altiarchaeales archaeon]|nr:hypothetical protein [Candidatus Altiarchaeales archaeon]